MSAFDPKRTFGNKYLYGYKAGLVPKNKKNINYFKMMCRTSCPASCLNRVRGSRLSQGQAFVPKKLDKRRVPVSAGCDKHPVPWHWTIIGDCSAHQRREHAARLVHQKIGCCKVPIVAVAAGKGCIAEALRDACEPQRQRMSPWQLGERR